MTIKELFTPRKPSEWQWSMGAVLFFVYCGANLLSARLFTPPAVISMGAGVGIAGLVLGGISLWPAIYLAALVSYFLNHPGNIHLFVLLILPAAEAAQAIIGTMLLKKLRFSPMLNHIRDGLAIFFVGIAASVVTPAFGLLAYHLDQYFFNTSIPPLTLSSWWAGTIVGMVVIAPFLIRWIHRPVFKRSQKDIREIAVAFGLLLMIGITLFFTPVTALGGISLIYLLLLPLFWIAIRLGPRFMTLAITLTGVMAIAGIFLGPAALRGAAAGQSIFQTEIFLIAIAGIFLVFVASEEERKEALKNVRSKVEKLENDFGEVSIRDRTKSEFLAVLAHELRNPLAPIVSSLEFLRLGGLVSAEALPILDEMDDRIKTIRRLLDDILDMSRISQNKFRLQKEYVEIQKIITRAVHSVEKNFEEREQTISVNMQKEPIRLNADAVRIEQAITNLLTNASKFTEKGGNIWIFVEQREGIAEIRIKDDGIGIDPLMLDQIFEPFLQIEGRRMNDGLGIGLALTKQLVEMHEGTIRARSEGHGRGTEFVIRLPVLPPQDDQADLHHERPLPLPSMAQAGHQILLVDDNVAAAHAIGKLLELMGYTLHYAYTGAEAIQKAEQVSPDSIIMDIGLPDMDGYEAAKAIRAKVKFSGTLIALTGYGQDEDKQKAHAAGFDHHLTKPIGVADLQKVLHD